MTAVICSSATGRHTELLDVAEPTLERYADRHGMAVHVERREAFDRPPSWRKILLLYRLLEDYETAVWVDADAMFVSFDRDILDTADLSRPLWMCFHRVDSLGHLLPNCGVLVAHRDDRLFDFFDEVWAQEQFIDHPWWEQAAVCHLLGYTVDPPGGFAHPGEETAWSDLVGRLGTEWNSMCHDPHPEPVIKHFTGRPFDERLAAMRAEAA